RHLTGRTLFDAWHHVDRESMGLRWQSSDVARAWWNSLSKEPPADGLPCPKCNATRCIHVAMLELTVLSAVAGSVVARVTDYTQQVFIEAARPILPLQQKCRRSRESA